MIEQEIKFFIPKKQVKRINPLFKQAHHISLHAKYFDTPHEDLRKRGIALRLRKEGNHWVQTLKAHGDQEISKIELNHPTQETHIQIEFYKDSPFYSILKTFSSELVLCYETLIERRFITTEYENSTIEIAYDTGEVQCQGLTHPICELEFELKSGHLSDLMAYASLWQKNITFT